MAQLLLILAAGADVAVGEERRSHFTFTVISLRYYCVTRRYIVRNGGHYAPLRPGHDQTKCKKCAGGSEQL